MKLRIFATLLACSVSSIAFAQSSKTEVSSDAKKQKSICRNYPVTGSRLKTERVCKTTEEWVKFDRDNNGSAMQMMGGSLRRGS